jgi:superfamily II DNA or RNA helicase
LQANIGEKNLTTLTEQVLYPYQREAAHSIAQKRRVLLADQPGLGKTLEVLGSMELMDLYNPEDSNAILILSPLVNVRTAWIRTIEQFLLPRYPLMTVVDLGTGSAIKKDTLLASALASQDTHPLIVVANHDTLALVKGKMRVPSLTKTFWSAVVIDESHMVLPITTPGSLTNFWKGLMRLEMHDTQNPIRIAISGTPDRGKLEHRYGTWRFLNPSLAPEQQWAWLEKTFNVYDRQVTQTRKVKVIGGLKDPAAWVEMDRHVTIRRTKEEVLPDLPPKTYHFIELPMKRDQYHAYKDAETQAIQDSAETPNALLTFAIKARQLATHAEGSSNKMEWLVQWLSERGYIEDVGLNTGKVVIASQFVKTLTWIRDELMELGVVAAMLTGDVSANNRVHIQQRFQDPADPLRIILLSGNMGVGIDLDVADDLIMIDLPYDPDKLEQIEDRIHRASNMHKVTIWHLLSVSTIDSAIAEKATTRRFATRVLLDGSRGVDFSRRVVDYITGDMETD